MLVSDRVITDACLLVFVLWRDNSRVFMRMRIQLFLGKADKARSIVYRSIYNRYVMAL